MSAFRCCDSVRLLMEVLVCFHRESSAQAQAAARVGEDPHHQSPPLQLLVEPLQEIGRFQVLVMLSGQR